MNQGQKRRILRTIYRRLFSVYGRQKWWPARSAFEMMVGAVLTQNTAWVNAAEAIAHLREEGFLESSRMARSSQTGLARLIRSSGYFNQKAKRLKTLAAYFQDRFSGRISRMKKLPVGFLREQLLALPGIGPETADSILLYALKKPIFVVDAYTRRILARHSLIAWDSSYEEIQSLFMRTLPERTQLYNEYHALIVQVGKSLCLKKRPKCYLCPLKTVGQIRLETPPATHYSVAS